MKTKKILKIIGLILFLGLVGIIGLGVYFYKTNPIFEGIVNNDESKLFYFPSKEMLPFKELPHSEKVLKVNDSINIYTYVFKPTHETDSKIFFIHGGGGNVSTYQDMIRSAIYRTDPKRFLFFNHDDEGKKYADDFLSSLNRRKENIDTPIKISSFRAQLKAIKKWGKEAPANLSQIQQQTLIINGDNDRMVPTKNSFVLSKKIPNKNLEIYSNAGHGSIFQYPKESSELINNFLF